MQDEFQAAEEAVQQLAAAGDMKRQDGWILLAVQFASGRSAMFRIEWKHAYRPPDPNEMSRKIFGDFEDTIAFTGEKLDPERTQWIEACEVKIPMNAYEIASWHYYAADDPKWHIPVTP